MKNIIPYSAYIAESQQTLFVLCMKQDSGKLKTATPVHQGDKVSDLQGMLKTCGVYKTAPNGVFDAKTKEAVMVFQKANGLVVDGLVGRQTLAALVKKAKTLPAASPKSTGGVEKAPETGILDRVTGYLSSFFGSDEGVKSDDALRKTPVYQRLKAKKASEYLARQVSYLSTLDRSHSGIDDNFVIIDDKNKALFLFDKNFNHIKTYPVITGQASGDTTGVSDKEFLKLKDTDPSILCDVPLPSFIKKKGVLLSTYINTKSSLSTPVEVEVASEDDTTSQKRSAQLVSYWFKWRTRNNQNLTPSGVYSFSLLKKGMKGYQDEKGGYQDGKALRLSNSDGKIINSAIHGTISAKDRVDSLSKAMGTINRNSVALSKEHTKAAASGTFNKTAGCTGMTGKDIDDLSGKLTIGSKVIILSDQSDKLLIIPAKSFCDRFMEAGRMSMDSIYQGFYDFKHTMKQLIPKSLHKFITAF
jgi:peptidoglycan hydrolase-like protein with peptidoglycan-binding domain